MITLCIDCLTDESHQCLFDEPFISQCELCFEKNKTCVEIAPNDALTRYANCLLKYNYDGTEYGGSDWPGKVEQIFRLNQWVFNFDRNPDSRDLQKIISRMLKHDGSGESNYFENAKYFRAWKNDSDGIVTRRLRDIFFGYGQLQEDVTDIYEGIREYLEEFRPEQVAFRARLGCNWKAEQKALGITYETGVAFDGDDLSAPPNALATNGRINRTGCSILYLAENEDTAIQEIRPNPGDLVSVGQFELKPSLKIANFYDANIINFIKTSHHVEILEMITNLNNLFSHPKGSFNHHHYLSTQMLAEILIRESYDGICYKSSFTGGRNIAIFEKSKSRYIPGSSKLVKIENVKVLYSETVYSVMS